MISVLMSIYKNENPQWFAGAFASITNGQSRKPDEVVLVCDGPLTEELDGEIEKCRAACSCLKVVRLEENLQLGLALREGVKNCSCDLVARMDTDDIAVPDRLKIQEQFMQEHPDIAACGGEIAEFETEGEIIRVKHMPTAPEDVRSYGKTRNPLNHMTVMFRRAAVEEVGSYQHFPLLEDYHLWSRMLAAGQKLANMDTVLVNARIGSSFAAKRGGRDYYARYKKLRQLQRDWGFLNGAEYRKSLILTFVMTRQPKRARAAAYKVLRRK